MAVQLKMRLLVCFTTVPELTTMFRRIASEVGVLGGSTTRERIFVLLFTSNKNTSSETDVWI